MFRALFSALLPFIVLISLPSCYAPQVYSDYNRSVDFRQYKSFAWIPRSDSFHNYFYDNQFIEKNIMHLANTEMLNRGCNIDTLEPDLLLEYYLTSQKKTYTVNNPGYMPNYGYNSPYNNPYGYNNYNNPYGYNNPYNGGYNQQQVEYLEGTLLINVIDRRTNELIWRGWSISSIYNEAQVESELPSEIHKIFNKYPITSRVAYHSPAPASWPQHQQPVRQQIQQQPAKQPAQTWQQSSQSAPASTNSSSPVVTKKKTKKKIKKNNNSNSSDEI